MQKPASERFFPQTDHPVINARYLLHEAQQAYYFGLPEHLALASVTSTPAIAAGLGHRIGVLEKGADADVVIWDSHPLQLGATPKRVWIDGLLQIPIPEEQGGHVEVGKGKEGEEWNKAPRTPNWEEERRKTVLWDGLPPLRGAERSDEVLFKNVKTLWRREEDGEITNILQDTGGSADVVVKNGKIACLDQSCLTTDEGTVVDLKGGSISPGMMTFGSLLGTEEIASEMSTGNGEEYDAMIKDVPVIVNDIGAVGRTMDALMFRTRNALYVAVSVPNMFVLTTV